MKISNKLIYVALLVMGMLVVSESLQAQRLGDLARQKEREWKQRAARVKAEYDSVCANPSIEAFDSFLSRYPKSKYAPKIKERKEDFYMWNRACNAGTASAYRDYINRSKYKYFAGAANDSISAVGVREEWNSVIKNPTVASLDAFIKAHPDAWQAARAKAMRSEIMAEDYFSRGDLDGAYVAFEDAGGRDNLKEENKPKYDVAAEHVIYTNLSASSSFYDLYDFLEQFPNSPHYKEISNLAAVALARTFSKNSSESDFALARELATDQPTTDKVESYIASAKAEAEAAEFATLSSSSSESELTGFLYKYPNSSHYNQVSDYIAVKRARTLTMYSTETDFANALRYARSPQAVKTVNAYISSAKNAMRQENARRRAARWKADGGVVNICWEFLDAGYNLSAPDHMDYQMNFNMGLGLRVGNYRSIVQFEVGVKPGIMLNWVEDDYDYSEVAADFIMPVYAKLKINMGKSRRCNAYLAGTFFYNAVRNDEYQRQFSFSGGFGVQWKVFDWQIIYYRQDFGAKPDGLRMSGGDDWSQFLGTSMACYFRL